VTVETGSKVRVRLAPTPSGALHAGNAYSFLLAWLWARHQGGSVVLRIEDVDTTRARPDWIEAIFRDLEWLGLDWDEGPAGPTDTTSSYRQSSPERQARYTALWEQWTQEGHLYPCHCTRAELRTDAPQIERIGDDLPPGIPYSGRCRERTSADASPTDAWRLRLPPRSSQFTDGWMGARHLERLSDLGDPVLRRGDGCTAYHLAVCADDFDQGITHVVRGRDLLGFAHLHSHLHELIANSCPPVFLHHGLLGDEQGARLAKRIGSGSLSDLRRSGMDPRLLVGRLADLVFAGTFPSFERRTARDLVDLGAPRPLLVDQTFSVKPTECP
jgi:glutamyl-tRNA synthetase